MTKPSPTANNRSVDTGTLGEDLVARWLENQGWEILERRWRCRWGELDIIAMEKISPMLVFVEVKTRRRRNWDGDGLLSITESKQEKLSLAAEVFLSDRPHLADYPCRFDVALVRYRLLSPEKVESRESEAIAIGDYEFVLQEYIKSAFSL